MECSIPNGKQALLAREARIIQLTEQKQTLTAQRDDLLAACKNSPAPNMFTLFTHFAEECSEKPSMAVYKMNFLKLATFLRSCTDRAEKTMQAIAKAESEG